ISEDILRDGRKSYENGLPPSPLSSIPVDDTKLGKLPAIQPFVNTFDSDPNSRQYQDVGLDGLTSNEEASFFNDSYLQKIATSIPGGASSAAYQNAIADPSGDNYHHFRGDDFDKANNGLGTPVWERYKRYNDMEGNSPTQEQSDKL